MDIGPKLRMVPSLAKCPVILLSMIDTLPVARDSIAVRPRQNVNPTNETSRVASGLDATAALTIVPQERRPIVAAIVVQLLVGYPTTFWKGFMQVVITTRPHHLVAVTGRIEPCQYCG